MPQPCQIASRASKRYPPGSTPIPVTLGGEEETPAMCEGALYTIEVGYLY